MVEKTKFFGEFKIYKYEDSLVNHGCGNDNMYTNGEANVIESVIDRNSVVFDIGCNKGGWTCLLHALQIPRIVYCFEPILETYKILMSRIFIRNDVKPFLCAMGDKPGKTKIKWYKNNDQMAEMSNLFGRPDVEERLKLEVEEVEVDIASIDDFCNLWDIGEIDFMKIDVEGAEWMVLQGAEYWIRKNWIKTIQWEAGGCYKDSGITLKQICKFLSERNYVIFRIVPEGLLHLEVWKDEMENGLHSNYLAAVCDGKNGFVPTRFENE